MIIKVVSLIQLKNSNAIFSFPEDYVHLINVGVFSGVVGLLLELSNSL